MYNQVSEELVRAELAARLGDFEQRHELERLTRARRLSRKAELAAKQARLALARAL